MKLSITALTVLLLSAGASAQTACTEPQDPIELLGFGDAGVTLSYAMTIDDEATGQGTFTAEVVHEHGGTPVWVGLGFSETGLMIPADAVLAFDGGEPEKYRLTERASSGVTATGGSLDEASFVQNATHSVLKFARPLVDGDSTIVKGSNKIIWALGSSNSFGIHANRGAASLTFEACIAETSSPTEAPILPEIEDEEIAALAEEDEEDPWSTPAPTPWSYGGGGYSGNTPPTPWPTSAPTPWPTSAPTPWPTKWPTSGPTTAPTAWQTEGGEVKEDAAGVLPPAKVDCAVPHNSIELVGPNGQGVTLTYVVNIEDESTGQGTFTAEVVHEHNGSPGWVGLGFSASGGMTPADAVISFDADTPKIYSLTGRFSGGVNAASVQNLQDHSFEQDETRSTLRFTRNMIVDGLTPITEGANNIIFAYGSSNAFGVHSNRGSSSITLQRCDPEAGPADTPAPTLPPVEQPTISPAPTQPRGERPEFAASVVLADGVITMNYVVELDEDDANNGYLIAEVVCECNAWLGFAVAESAGGSMVGADAIIALPDDNEVTKYSLSARNINGVNEVEGGRQTLEGALVDQNATHTVMFFKKRLVEPNEEPILATGINTFLWAYGFGNSLSTHKARGGFDLDLADGGLLEVETPGTYQSFWATHGTLAATAWGILSPLAIGSSLLRDMIPSQALWFKLHMFLNMTVFIFTLIAFTLAVTALQLGTVEGEDPGHFRVLTHRTVGLAIMLLVLVQVLGGMFRPHPPAQKPYGKEGELEEKAPARLYWEILHKGSGYGLVALCWWEVQEGIRLYSERFGTADLRPAFWATTGIIAGSILIVW
eukprot:CAMPEP_0194028620 /NCGR_PEP_ID=MMETSP0009_2-20130614/2548_1 /TAXON_ID=210454 /ORGANISM="Grammatophora oceanica, Strain CCMP 410" /LENGTH=826 /DNA_ID=CAMNT_0038668065 /DNA_START=146 /DNA_END=2623 /DNA_ORIENTATION=+